MSNSAEVKPLVLVFPFGILSHYLRCLMLCRHFRNHFDIRIAYHPDFASFIKQEHVGTFDCEALNSGSAVESVKQFDFSWMNESALKRVYHEQVNIITKLKPVAVIGDYSLTLKMAAEATSVLYISVVNGYMSKYYAGYRKISRTHPVYPFLKKMPGSVQMLLTKRGEKSALRQLHKPFKAIRIANKLQKCKEYLDELEGDITLVCDLVDLFPQLELPSDYHVIAPLFYESVLSSTGFAGKIDRTKKTILASMGSTGDWPNLSFLNDPFFAKYNIIAAADHSRILDAPHIMHVNFVHIHDVYPATDLIICHGGNGTINQALLYQIPLLCKSSHCEQEWNIQALEDKGLGKSLDEITELDEYKKITAEWIQKKGTQPYKDCSEKMKEQLALLPDMVTQIAGDILKTCGAISDMAKQQIPHFNEIKLSGV